MTGREIELLTVAILRFGVLKGAIKAGLKNEVRAARIELERALIALSDEAQYTMDMMSQAIAKFPPGTTVMIGRPETLADGSVIVIPEAIVRDPDGADGPGRKPGTPN